MTIGIYLLEFNNTHKVYIGQSKNVEGRLVSHKTSMKRGISSKKLTDAYSKHGTPILHLLVECEEKDLNDLEDFYIKEFNSVEDGFNTMSNHGYSSSLKGEDCGNSKYSDETIYKIFTLLIAGSLHKDIEAETGVTRGVIADVSSLKTHKWLKLEYPEQYAILEDLFISRRTSRRTAISRGISYPLIEDPLGKAYNVESIRGFAREHDLNPNAIGRVLRKQALSYKGWKLQTV